MEKSITNSPGKPNRKKKKRTKRRDITRNTNNRLWSENKEIASIILPHILKTDTPPIVDTKERKGNAYLISEYQFYFTATFHKT